MLFRSSRAVAAVHAALAADGDLLAADERAAVDAAIAAVEAATRGSDKDAITAAAAALEAATRPFAERRMDRGIRAALAGRHIDTVKN